MWRLLVGFVAVALTSASVYQNGRKSFSIYETPEKIMSNGYPAERHYVTTQDGYKLEMHRIPRGKDEKENSDRPVVFLMHGITSASAAFIAIGPKLAMAYNFADAGFDVWMGNARGTRNSRNHTSLNPDDPKEKKTFFDFTFEEIGTIDVAAMVDYALATTGRKDLHYIGHSQGGTVFLVLASMRPEYNAKFKSAHLLAGVGYQKHFPDPEVAKMAADTDMIYNLAVLMGIVELYPDMNISDLVPNMPNNLPSLCVGEAHYAEICGMLAIDKITVGSNPESSTPDTSSASGGAAVKQFAHYGQNIRDKEFRRWNFGTGNMAAYQQAEPPIYNLSLITTNVTMHYTIADNLLDERDVLAMIADMPNAQARKVARDTFTHADFAIADDSKELVTEYIIYDLKCAENSPECAGMLPDSSSSIAVSSLLKALLLIFVLRIINVV